MKNPVVVVGAGPVGLSMALELGVRGQDVVVLEAGDGSVNHPRAGGLSMRTMEFCRRWGIVDDVRNCGFPGDYDLDIVFSTGLHRHELIREHYPALDQMDPPSASPERRQRCPQMWFDPILARAVDRQPTVDLRYGCRVESVREVADSAVVDYTDIETGKQMSISCDYVVACDGAMSRVRADLGIPTSGIDLLNYSVGVFFRSESLLERTGHHDVARVVFMSPEGPVGNLTVVDGRDLWRFTYMAGQTRPVVSAAEARAVMHSMLGDVQIEILDVAPWRRSQLVADSYRRGRVFLVGDSAHTMSPTGGFGSNTGIGEAVDLGWKLDAVRRGWGGPELLDSYEAERRPIAVRNSEAATRNFRGWYSERDLSSLLDDSPEGEALRREVGDELISGTRAEWESQGVILGYRYENSPICVSDQTPAPPDDFRSYEPTTRPGHRAPHAWMPDGRSTLDLFGEGFVLLVVDDQFDDTSMGTEARTLGIPYRVELLPAALSGVYTTRYTLVRPDGHVAWRGDRLPEDPAAVIRKVTGHPPASPNPSNDNRSHDGVTYA